MKILLLTVGAYQENCYIIVNEKTKQGVVIDPGAEAERIENVIKQNMLRVEGIFLTHGHHDHIGALEKIRSSTKAKVYVHTADAERLSRPADIMLTGDEIINIANLELKTIAVPGHTPGGICYMVGKHVFVGDVIFSETIGRTDLPGGSYKDLIGALKTKILTLPEDTQLHPGHGPSTDVAWEKKMNPFLQ